MNSRGDFDSDPRSLLVILPTWVGDFVMATPALRAVRERFANAHIVFLMESNLRDLVRGGDWMDECVEWPGDTQRTPLSSAFRDLVWDLRRRRFDWILLFPNSFRSALFAWFVGGRRRIGYNRDGRSRFLTDRIPVRNRRRGSETVPPKLPVRPGRFTALPMVEYYADLVEAIGCRRSGHRLELFTAPADDGAVGARLAERGIDDRHPLVVLSPGAKFGASKCWPADRFAALADRLITRDGASVVVTCGPGEEPIARRIGDAMTRPGFILEDPLWTLGELKSLVKRCDLLIGNDAGPRHLAKAFGVPVVTIFGPTDPKWTATNYPLERVVRVDVDCGPCQQRICPLGHARCMTEVTVDTVYAAATELLASRTGIECRPEAGRPTEDCGELVVSRVGTTNS